MGSFWRASWRNTVAQLEFFLVVGTGRVFFWSQVVSGSDFGRFLGILLAVLDTIFKILCASNKTRSAPTKHVLGRRACLFVGQFLHSLIYSNGLVTPILICTLFGKICFRGYHALVAEAVFIVLIARVQENQARA